MKDNKKVTTLILVLVLMIAGVLGGTLAYWQWITSTEQQTLVNVSLTDDATILIDFPDNEITNLYPTSDCEANGTSSWVTDITVNNGTGVKLATNFKLKIKIEDKDGNVITNGTNEWNTQPFRYYIKYAVTEENESCQNALIKGRFDSDVLTYANVANNDPHYSERNYWYDSTSITKKGADGFPIVSSRIDSGVSFHALPNRETSHRYKVWVWLDKEYTSVTVGNDSTLDKMQDAKITVSWSENSELEQVKQIQTPQGEAIAIYSDDDKSLRFYRETNPSSVTVNSIYNGRKVTEVYTGFEKSVSNIPWISVFDMITNVVFEDYVYPVDTSGWFADMILHYMDVTKLDVSNVTNMSSMFVYTQGIIVGLETWNTSNVTNMEWMFDGSFVGNKLDLSGWSVCNVANYEFFSDPLMGVIVEPYFGDLSKCNGGNPKDGYNPRAGEAIAVYSEDDSSLRFYREEDLSSVIEGEQYRGWTVTSLYTDFEHADYDIGASRPWLDYWEVITTVVFEDYVYPESTVNWFYGFGSCETIDVTKLDTSNTTNMRQMFGGTPELQSIIGLENFDTSKVTNMENMFASSNLQNKNVDLSGWNVCNVTEYTDFVNSGVALMISPYFGDSSRCNGGNPA